MVKEVSASKSPLVTVAIPAYNAEAYIEEAVESVLSQDYPNIELLIIDDCSSDKTFELLEKVEDSRVRLLKNDVNLGAEGNWNRCLELAGGYYFTLLPGDDVLYPGSISKRVNVLEADVEHELAFCFCDRSIIDASGKKVMDVSFCKQGKIKRNTLLRKNVTTGMNVIGEPAAGIFRTGLAREVGRYNHDLPYVIDLDYWVRLLKFGDAYHINESLCAFRVTSENWSSRLGKLRFEHYRKMIKKIGSLPYSDIGMVVQYLGIFRAWVNEYLRRLFYLFFRR